MKLEQMVQIGAICNFKCENAWNFDTGFQDVVMTSWNNNASYFVVPWLEACASELYSWSRNNCN